MHTRMTSPESSHSIADLQNTAAAFALERQVLMKALSRSTENKEQVAAGLLLCLSFLVGQTISGTNIAGIDRIYPVRRNQGLIDFKLVCLLPSQVQLDLGICILTASDFEVVNEACTQLLAYKDFGLDRLCLLRPSHLITNVRLPTYLPKLLSTDIGGTLLPLTPRDLLNILTTLAVFQHRKQFEVTNETLFAYLQQEELLIENELIKSIIAAARQ